MSNQQQRTLEEVLQLILESTYASLSRNSSLSSSKKFPAVVSSSFTSTSSITIEPELEDILSKYDEILQKYEIQEYNDRTIYKTLLSLSLTPGNTWYDRLQYLIKVRKFYFFFLKIICPYIFYVIILLSTIIRILIFIVFLLYYLFNFQLFIARIIKRI